MFPAHANNLDACLQEAFRLLRQGMTDRRSPFHTPVLATSGVDGMPSLRTVVLRGFDQDERWLRIHSDARSAKMAELTARPGVAVLGYDAAQRIQLRLTGTATLQAAGSVVDRAWADSQPQSRLCYAVTPGPGTPIPAPLPAPISETGARANFAVIQLQFDTLEWLWLASAGHRRARFTWPPRAASATWLVP